MITLTVDDLGQSAKADHATGGVETPGRAGVDQPYGGGESSSTLQRLRQFAQLYGCSMESLVSKASDQPSDMARWLEQELLALEDVDRVFVLEQAKGLIDRIKFRRERPAPKKLATSR